MKGNVLDLAVGVVIGAAFGKIIDSLVNDLVNPIIGMALGKVDLTNKFIALAGQNETTYEAAKKAGAALGYGSFLNSILQFMIVAFVIFMIVKSANNMRKQQAEAPAATPAQEVLLTEIRDALRARS